MYKVRNWTRLCFEFIRCLQNLLTRNGSILDHRIFYLKKKSTIMIRTLTFLQEKSILGEHQRSRRNGESVKQVSLAQYAQLEFKLRNVPSTEQGCYVSVFCR